MKCFKMFAAIVIFLLGMVPGVTFAQEMNRDPAELHKRWHDASIDYRPLTPWRLDMGVTFGFADLHEDGDAGMLGSEIKLTRLLGDLCGSMNVYGGLRLRAFGMSDSEGTDHGKVRPRDPLDREEYTAELYVEAVSHTDQVNHRLAYRFGGGVGGGYQDQNGHREVFVCSANGEVALQLQGYEVGPFAGFDGRFGLGEHNTTILSVVTRLGLRYVNSIPRSPVPEARVYALFGGSSEEATASGVQKGTWRGKSENELDTQFVGVGVMARIANITLSLEGGMVNSWSHQKDASGQHFYSREQGGFAQANFVLAF